MRSNIGVSKKGKIKGINGEVKHLYTLYYKNSIVKYRVYLINCKGENNFYLHKVPKEEDKIRIYA